MKKIFLAIAIVIFTIGFSSCKYCFKYYEEKSIIENILSERFQNCNWKVQSITDTIGYSITPFVTSLSFYSGIGKDYEFNKCMDVCSEQSFNWTENKGGVERRLLIAHCINKYGDKQDFEVFNEVKGGKSIRYYLALDEVSYYLETAKSILW